MAELHRGRRFPGSASDRLIRFVRLLTRAIPCQHPTATVKGADLAVRALDSDESEHRTGDRAGENLDVEAVVNDGEAREGGEQFLVGGPGAAIEERGDIYGFQPASESCGHSSYCIDEFPALGGCAKASARGSQPSLIAVP